MNQQPRSDRTGSKLMGIIRPKTHADGADRWSVALATSPDDHLIGTRAAVLDLSEQMTQGSIDHLVYRRPAATADWQLVARG